MKIAAVIPTCDRPELLQRALRSVTEQQRPVDEIIVVNDGLSTVNVPEAQVVRSGPHAGPAAARNAGVWATDADVICFLDDDDTWAPSHVSAAAELLEHHDIAATGLTQVNRRGGTTLRAPPSALVARDWLSENQGVQGSNLCVTRSAFAALRGFDELLWCGEDVDLMIRAANLGLRYRASPRATVAWHRHDGARITDPSPRHAHAHRTFLAAHGGRMTADQVSAYRARTLRYFGVDPGPVPKLVWVLGPPGAGKTTWSMGHAGEGDRVMDMCEAMEWLDSADLGVRTAKRHMAAAIRAVEGQRPDGGRRLFVTPAYFDPEDLGPALPFEHIVCVVPSEARWRVQLQGREGHVDPRHVAEHARWASRFGTGARAAQGSHL